MTHPLQPRRRGMTLTEILVAVLVFMLVLAILISMRVSLRKQEGQVRRISREVRAMCSLREHVRWDLARSAPGLDGTSAVTIDTPEALTIGSFEYAFADGTLRRDGRAMAIHDLEDVRFGLTTRGAIEVRLQFAGQPDPLTFVLAVPSVETHGATWSIHERSRALRDA